MADIAATLSTAQGWAKPRFGKVQRLAPPKIMRVTKRIKFNDEKKLGKSLDYPVYMNAEGGFTHGPGSTLNEAKAAQTEDASLSGKEITLRSLIDIKTLTSHMSSQDSFGNWFDEHMINCKRSFARRLETVNVYGGASIAQLSAVSGSGTTRTFTISNQSFAPHIWLGTRTHELDAYNATDKLNDLASIVITGYNPSTREITVSGNATDLTAVDGAGVATELYWKGQYGTTASGLYTIGATQSSTEYAAINHATYPDMWQGSLIDVGGVAFDWQALYTGLEENAGRGGECPLVALASLATWGNLMADISALKVFDSSYKMAEAEFGHRKVTFMGPNGMQCTIEPSGMIKRGHVIAFPDVEDEDYSDLVERVGSTDVTVMHPADKGEMIVQVPGTNYFETKFYSDQAIKANPRDIVVYYNITPAT